MKKKQSRLPLLRYQEFVNSKNQDLKEEYGTKECLPLLLPDDYLYRIPWKAPPKEIQEMASYINALHVPSGLTDKFQLFDVFSRQGQLRGAEVITLLEDCMDYFLIPCNVVDTYKQYYSMLSSDVREMGKPFIKSDDDIDRVFNRIVETIAVHEGIFPIFLSDFVYHEMVDVIHHIKCQGPQKAFSTISGERANAVLKKFVRNGGRNSMKSVLNNYLHAEAYSMFKAYSNELENTDTEVALCKSLREDLYFLRGNDGKIAYYQYNNWYFKINSKKYYKERLTDFEMIQLVSMLLREVEKQSFSKEAAAENSALYLTYSKWLAERESNSYGHLMQHEKFYFWLKRQYMRYPAVFHDAPIVSELFLLEESILKSSYRFCSIYGVKFSSRGMIYRATVSEDIENDLSTLQKEWWIKHQYSSWCQYREKHQANDPMFGNIHSSLEFAQINGFFRICLPSDLLLNGVPLASISHRKTKNYQQTARYDFGKKSRRQKLFVAASNIIASRQLIAGFDEFNKCWKFKGSNSNYHSTKPRKSIKYLICVPLDRKNDCIEFSIHNSTFYNDSNHDKD